MADAKPLGGTARAVLAALGTGAVALLTGVLGASTASLCHAKGLGCVAWSILGVAGGVLLGLLMGGFLVGRGGGCAVVRASRRRDRRDGDGGLAERGRLSCPVASSAGARARGRSSRPRGSRRPSVGGHRQVSG